ncbi:Cullin repeat-like-containing domain protein [Mycena crocata]|nr:Cullin repeat-like-containing domain protein [Mycena crocata]
MQATFAIFFLPSYFSTNLASSIHLFSPSTMTDRSDINHVWATQFEQGIRQMLRGDEPLDVKSHMAMYTAGYNWCTTTRPSANPGTHGGAVSQSADLYARLSRFLSDYTTEIYTAAPADDLNLVEYYDAEWDRFAAGAPVLHRVFNSLGRAYIKPARAEGRTDVEEVVDLAISHWKTNVFKSLAWRLAANHAEQVDVIYALFVADKVAAEDFKKMRLQAV